MNKSVGFGNSRNFQFLKRFAKNVANIHDVSHILEIVVEFSRNFIKIEHQIARFVDKHFFPVLEKELDEFC